MRRSTCSLLAILAGLSPLAATAQDSAAFDLGTLVLSSGLSPQPESRARKRM